MSVPDEYAAERATSGTTSPGRQPASEPSPTIAPSAPSAPNNSRRCTPGSRSSGDVSDGSMESFSSFVATSFSDAQCARYRIEALPMPESGQRRSDDVTFESQQLERNFCERQG